MSTRRLVRGAIVFGAYALLLAYFVWPILASGHRLGIDDWDPLFVLHASVFRSLYEYAQLPFWNPWSCGGDVLWQNPQSSLISPTYLFATVTSLPVAMKWNLALHYAIGLAGMRTLLTRACGLTFEPAVLFLSAVYVFGGGEAFHLAVGHATFLAYFYLPWLLWFYVAAVRDGQARAVVGAAAVLALGVYTGAIYLTFMIAVGLGLFSIAAACVRREWRPFGVLAGTGAIGILLAAPKLLPTVLFIRDPRVIDIRFFWPSSEVMTPAMLLNAFLNPFQMFGMMFPGQNYGWHEYTNYIGPFAAAVLAGSFVWIVTEKPWARSRWLGTSLVATAVVLFVLMLGEFSAYAPYTLLHRLPVMSSFRLPSRYTLVFLLFGTTAAGWTLRTAVGGRSIDRREARLVGLVLVFSTILVADRNRAPLANAFQLAPAPVAMRFLDRPAAPAIDAQTDGFGHDAPMMRDFAAHRALLNCNEPLLLPGAVDPAKPVVFADGDAVISSIAFSPNRVTFAAVTRNGARAFLNERFVRGWRSPSGPLALDRGTNLAYLSLPPGSAGRFTFLFVPAGLWAGVALAAVGALLSIGMWRRESRSADAGSGGPQAASESV